MKVLYLGMQWDYGDSRRGYSFEHDNFYATFQRWGEVKDLRHFDYVALGQEHGIEKMSDMLLREVDAYQPDAMFSVWFDPNHDPQREVVRKITEKTPVKTMNWFCDSHWRYGDFDRPWADCLTHCITTSTVAYEWYVRDGLGSKVIKSQWAYSPKYEYKGLRQRDKDVTFVGQPHGNRREKMGIIEQAGIPIEAYGHGWPRRRITLEEMIEMFRRTKVNLNFCNSSDAKWLQLKGRNFEIPAVGGFLLTEYAENLDEYYEIGKEIETFRTNDEMVEKIRHYVRNDAERERIAAAGLLRARRDHSYEQRFVNIFEKAGLIG